MWSIHRPVSESRFRAVGGSSYGQTDQEQKNQRKCRPASSSSTWHLPICPGTSLINWLSADYGLLFLAHSLISHYEFRTWHTKSGWMVGPTFLLRRLLANLLPCQSTLLNDLPFPFIFMPQRFWHVNLLIESRRTRKRRMLQGSGPVPAFSTSPLLPN